ncbi:MAG TPA: hypothetical protein VI795_03115 [Patescibacteria group bacterium]|nr:hypothetical protein [Patescibacteria group bacterium]
MIKRLDNEKIDLAQFSHKFVREKEEEVRKIFSKLKFLLDSYLEQDIDRESYLSKKNDLLSQKKTIEEKIFLTSNKLIILGSNPCENGLLKLKMCHSSQTEMT